MTRRYIRYIPWNIAKIAQSIVPPAWYSSCGVTFHGGNNENDIAFLTSVILATASAHAADIARPVYKAAPVPVASYNWTGFYIGGNAGYAWGESHATSSFTCPDAGGGCPFAVPANLAAFTRAGAGAIDADGFTGGGQAGYNWQSGVIVLGVEADFNAFDLSGSRQVTGPVPSIVGSTFTSTTSFSTDWLFTGRARLGWVAAPNLLLYGTGGVAITEIEASNAFSDTGLSTSGASSARDTKVGYAVGGGAEWAIEGNWTVKAEYLYVDFGSGMTTAAVGNAGPSVDNVFATSVDLSAHIVRGGLNYRF